MFHQMKLNECVHLGRLFTNDEIIDDEEIERRVNAERKVAYCQYCKKYETVERIKNGNGNET